MELMEELLRESRGGYPGLLFRLGLGYGYGERVRYNSAWCVGARTSSSFIHLFRLWTELCEKLLEKWLYAVFCLKARIFRAQGRN